MRAKMKLTEAKLEAINNDEELLELHRKIMGLHKKLAEKLAKKEEIIKLEAKLDKVEKELKERKVRFTVEQKPFLITLLF